MRMTFVSNHDKNSWEGTAREQFGDALDAAVVLSVVGEGIPMVYNGQEAGLDKRLAFFDRDPIPWRDDPQGTLYRRLFALKKAHPALWNGAWGAAMERVPNTAEQWVLSFVRRHLGDPSTGEPADIVFAVFNFSDRSRRVSFGRGPHPGGYTDAFTGAAVEVAADSMLTLPAWGYVVLVKSAG
jgi:hypothetical protein